MTVTPLYAALLALFFMFLSFRVIGLRRSAGIGLGDGGNSVLFRRQRAHGNFAEYVPLALLLMALAELQGLPAWKLHAIGLLLVAGRPLHAFGVSREPEVIRLRAIGMILTFGALLAGSVGNLVMAAVSLLSGHS
ncbi:MAG: MAPEG family protein [Dongiaceae bacterium]